MATEIIHTINADEGIEVHVARLNDGRFSVGIYDVATAQYLPSRRIFPADQEAKAIEYARTV